MPKSILKNEAAWLFLAAIAILLATKKILNFSDIEIYSASVSFVTMLAFVEIAVFLIPLTFIFLREKNNVRAYFSLRFFEKNRLPIIFWSSLTLSILSAAVNCIFLMMSGFNFQPTAFTSEYQILGYGFVGAVFVDALIPAVFEELLFRGAILTAMQNYGDGIRIFFSGLFFALMHMNPINFVSPMIAGMVYAYITLRTGSIYLAIFAHFLNNCAVLFVNQFVAPHIDSMDNLLLLSLIAIVALFSVFFAVNEYQKIMLKEGIQLRIKRPFAQSLSDFCKVVLSLPFIAICAIFIYMTF